MRLLTVLLALVMTAGAAHAEGRVVFNTNCVICHQADGKGLPGMYPPLADSVGRYVATASGRAYLVHVVSFGMNGPISVHGQTFDGVMYPWPQFSDEEMAEVLNYVLTTFNAKLLPSKFKPLTAAEVKKYRVGNLSTGDVHLQRETLLKSLSAHQGGR